MIATVDHRQQQLRRWLAEYWPGHGPLQALTGDAGFRRYYRFMADSQSLLAVDAPLSAHDKTAVVVLSEQLAAQGISVPQIYQHDWAQGFFVIADFGSVHYFDQLKQTPEQAEQYYLAALQCLRQLSGCVIESTWQPPDFDQTFIRQELQLFNDWFLTKHLQLTMTAAEQQLIEQLKQLLIDTLQQQPQRLVHRDYHCRNLMVLANQSWPGVIDFQGMMRGPLVYDVVSLLQDAYLAWPRQQVVAWLRLFWQQLNLAEQQAYADFAGFERAFDLTGLQRHLKNLGVFARLCHRDDKPGYLAHMPQLYHYILSSCMRYPQCAEFATFCQQRLGPSLGL